MKTAHDITRAFGTSVALVLAINGTDRKLRPSGASLDVNAVYKWRERNQIPKEWYAALLAAAKATGADVSTDDLIYHPLAVPKAAVAA